MFFKNWFKNKSFLSRRKIMKTIDTLKYQAFVDNNSLNDFVKMLENNPDKFLEIKEGLRQLEEYLKYLEAFNEW